MKKKGDFIKAYHDFRDSIDFSKSGILPDLENLVWYMLMGAACLTAGHTTPVFRELFGTPPPVR